LALSRTFALAAQNAASGTGLTTGTFDSSAGKFLVVFTKHEGAPTTISVTDNKGSGTLTPLTKINHSNNDLSVQLHYGVIGTPGTGHTVTMTLAAARVFRDCKVWLLNADGTVALDVEATGGQGNGTAATTSSYTTSAAAISIMGASEDTTSSSYTPGTGWTEDSDENSDFGGSRSDASAGTFTANCTIGTSVDWVCVAAAFKETASFTLEQEGFRFGEDDDDEAGHTWTDSQDTSITAAAGTKLLRTLVDATDDPAAIAYTLYAQKNGSGGYSKVAVGSTSKTRPVIEAADVTESGNNTASSSWAVSYPNASTGDLLIFCVGWDDSTNTTALTAPSGPNGETISVIENVAASSSTSVRGKVFYTVATGTWTASTLTFTPNASEQWSAQVIRVPAGEFDSSTPIGAHNNLPSSTTGNPSTPTLSAGASDGSGTLVAFIVGDTDDADGTMTGWTGLASTDRGAVGVDVLVRDAAITDSESVSSSSGLTYPSARDWVSFCFVVRAPSASNECYISTSSNIASGGEATTARLTAPSGKSTSDFVTGRRWDDENGTDTIDVTSDDYTEVEWSVTLTGSLSNGDYFDFRVYQGASPLDTYTVTPRWTIGSGAASYTLTTSVGAFTLTGNATGITAQRKLATSVGTFTYTGNATGLKRGYPLVTSVGTFTFNGVATSLTAQRKIATSAGSFALTGIDTTLTYTPASKTLIAGTGAFTLTGNASGLTAQRKLSTSVGTFALTGNSSSLTAQRKLSAASGAYTLTGVDVTLTYTPTPGAYTMQAESATFVLTGNDVALTYAPKSSEQPSGGYSWYESAHYYRALRRKKQKEREEQEREIQNALDRQIAQLLHDQEIKDAERADLERIQSLADSLMNQKTDLPRPVLASVMKAHEERTFSALSQLERVASDMVEAEDMAIAMILFLDDTD
jgi:hypothetical protein